MRKPDPACVFLSSKENLLSLNALAASVECTPGHERTALYFEKNYAALSARIEAVIAERGVCAAGFSFFTSRFEETVKTAAKLRGHFKKGLYLVAGGPHATALPQTALSAGFDAACIGEGEDTFPELLKAIAENPAGPAFETVRGIMYACGGKPARTAPRPQADLARFPSISQRYARYGAVEISRGCPHGCNFCQTTRIFGPKIRHRPAALIAEQVRFMRTIGFVDVRLITSNAFAYGSPDGITLNLPALEELLSALTKVSAPGGRIYFGSFPSEVRPEHVTRETVALVKRYAANDNLIIGAQSGSERMLQLSNRHHGVKEITRALEITRQAGLKTNLDFIFGLPGETGADALETVRFIRAITGPGVRIHAHTFMPLPGTPFADAPLNHNREYYEPLVRELIRHGRIYGGWISQKTIAEHTSASAAPKSGPVKL
ncbi:MAG: TIGR04013 family B12-binding domain/radical SAM domain-containing protein [Elusimicrobiaceae bacterium]|nr:TIGR04013 family B12-binding domain/radical SAM domain-containing protein [Elusimicrobiaceae bacterium]